MLHGYECCLSLDFAIFLGRRHRYCCLNTMDSCPKCAALLFLSFVDNNLNQLLLAGIQPWTVPRFKVYLLGAPILSHHGLEVLGKDSVVVTDNQRFGKIYIGRCVDNRRCKGQYTLFSNVGHCLVTNRRINVGVECARSLVHE